MTKILTISASPVVDSSTDLILKRLTSSLVNALGKRCEPQVWFLRLNELSFIPCQACGKAPTPEFCFFDDALVEPYRALAECDCLIFGSPIYFDSVSAQAKMFIDRCNCFRPADFESAAPEHRFVKIMKRKRPGAMVLVGGERGWFEGARRVVAGFFKWVEVVNEGQLYYRSPSFGKVGYARDDAEIMQKADQLGRELAALMAGKS